MAPMYGALHFIPMILFKRKKFFASPFKMILKAALGTLRSATFLGTFVAIYQCSFNIPTRFLVSLTPIL